MVFLTDRFSIDEIINKTIIIHAHLDDFTSQLSSNAGEMIGCGEIVPIQFICDTPHFD